MIVGRVYVVKTALARPRKDKITLCICAADNFFFWINTDPRHDGIGQFELRAADHTSLRHDCYLDCSRATTFPPHELAAAAERDQITRALAARIVAYLRANPPKTLAPRYLNLAIRNLEALL